jgi:serine/threonine-protein kinase
MLIDFGIAKQAADGTQTRALARAATHGFSPPEQAMGTGTDPRSDVYALAATFYALVTGTVPTPAHERVAGVELADPTTLVPELPASMGAALLQALSLNINRRPASIEAFLHAMGLMATPAEEAASTSRTVLVGDLGGGRDTGVASVRIRSERLTVAPMAPPVQRRSRAGIWAAVSAMALGAAGGGLWFLQQEEAPAPPVAQQSSPPMEQGTVTAGPPKPAPATPMAATPVPEPATAHVPAVEPTAQVQPAIEVRPDGSPPSATPPTASASAPAPQEPATVAITSAPPPRQRPEPAAEGTTRSAMDAFESRRAKSAVEESEVLVTAPVEPEKVVKPKPKPKPATAPSGGASGWTGVYIGGSRRE